MTQQKKNGNLIAIITMFFLFAMISFVTNLAAPFGTIWKNEYAGANTLGMMGNMMNFLAYLFMGIPAGNMLVKSAIRKRPSSQWQWALSACSSNISPACLVQVSEFSPWANIPSS